MKKKTTPDDLMKVAVKIMFIGCPIAAAAGITIRLLGWT